MAKEDITQDPMEKALADLDELEKSFEEDGGLDELIKSLEEETEALEKSGDGDGDGGGKDDGGDGGGDGDANGDVDDGDPVDKSMDEDFSGELIKASEAYASLEKSVSEGIEGVSAGVTGLAGEVSSLQKSMSALLALNVKQAKVIGTLVKSVQEMGAKPVGQSSTKLGIGSQAKSDDGTMTKSHSEISDLLLKAVQEEKVDAHYLSMYGVYKTTDVLPDDVKTAIGI